MRMIRVFVLVVLAACVSLLPACGDNNGAAADGGTDGGAEFTCPNGVNPDGNGCCLPCEDGWHEGPDGACLADCPTISEDNEDGECEVHSCPSGWSVSYSELIETGAPLYFCSRDCPSSTSLSDHDCVKDCGNGWSLGSDGRCHLDCPDGMTAGDGVADCTPDDAGENKTCPDGTFDLSIDGPNPVFVDGTAGADTNNGSEGSPYATIGHAIEMMGNSATVYLAAGEYPEYVLVEGKTELNLVGSCAADVRIAPTAPAPESHGDLAGAVEAHDVDIVRINGVTVASPGYGIRIEHTGDSGSPGDVTVEQVRVESATVHGIRVSGPFVSSEVANASVTQAVGGILCEDPTFMSDAVATVRDSHVFDLLPGSTTDDVFVSGIEVNGGQSVEITGNLVEHLTRTFGITANRNSLATLVERNSVRDLHGGAGVACLLNANNPTIADNVIADVAADPDGWDPIGEGCPFGAWIRSAAPFHSAVSRTAFARIQGVGVGALGSSTGDSIAEFTDNEIVDSAAGVVGQFKSLVMTGNRMDGLGSFLFTADDLDTEPVSDFEIRSNSFSNRAAPTPPAPDPSLATEVIDSQAVYVYGASLVFEGNTMYGNTAIPVDTGVLPQLQFDGGSLIARDNSISGFEGTGILSSPTTAEISGNRLLDGDDGLVLDGLEMPVGGVVIDSNFFFAMGNDGISAYWLEWNEAVQLTSNTLVLASIDWGVGVIMPGSGLVATGNHFIASGVWVFSVLDASFEDNLLTYSGLYAADQPEGSVLVVGGNGFRHSGLILLQVDGEASVTGNGFVGGDAYYAYGVGIGEIDSTGPLSISRNVFSGVATAEIESVGEVGDGAHLVGNGDAIPVDIRWNLFRGNGRAGLLLHDATGIVEGNMYLDNGAGPEGDFVLQASAEGAVTGWDTGFATVPSVSFGVLQKENLGWE